MAAKINCATDRKVHADRAALARAGSPAQLHGWQAARDRFARAVRRFESLSKRINLDYPDRTTMDDAVAGLTKSQSELARLESATGQ